MSIRCWLPLAVLVLAGSLAVGCGDQRADGEQSGSGSQWRSQTLGISPGPDQASLLITDGDDVLVLAVSGSGEVSSSYSAGGSDFERGSSIRTGLTQLELGGGVRLPGGDWLVLGSGGQRQVDGDEQPTYDVLGLRSPDGRTWEQVAVTGFDHPVEIGDMVVHDDRIVVAGTSRLARDPGRGGFRAGAWVSADGVEFEEVVLPGVPEPRGFRGESVASEVAVVFGRLLLAGTVGSRIAVWDSADGSGWSPVESAPDAYGVQGLEVLDGVALMGITEGRHAAYRSADQGQSWQAVVALPVSQDEIGGAPVWVAGRRLWTLTGVDDDSWSDPEVCYADLDRCGRSPGPSLVVSSDGESWTRMDLARDVEAIAGTDDGRVLVMEVTGEGIAVATLPNGAELPLADEPVVPERVELVQPPEDGPAEVGVRYHAPLYTHCGMDWLFLGDQPWRRTDNGPDVETGAGDEAEKGWPQIGETIYGYATLTEPDELDYTTEDGVLIATYARGGRPPGCD